MTKVSELAGADLALWAARAIKYEVRQESERWLVFVPFEQCWRSLTEHGWRPDRDWSVGGPLIEKYSIDLEYLVDPVRCTATSWDGTEFVALNGPTPLIAAMRALVASVYGDEVES